MANRGTPIASRQDNLSIKLRRNVGVKVHFCRKLLKFGIDIHR